MSNKNKYNNYFNNNQHNESEHSHEVQTLDNHLVDNEEVDVVETTEVTSNVQNEEIIETPEVVVKDSEENLDITENTDSIDETNGDGVQTTLFPNVRVNTKALNVRKEPNKEADIVTIVYQDELLILCESTSIDGFYKVKTYTGFDGYCMEQFVDLV